MVAEKSPPVEVAVFGGTTGAAVAVGSEVVAVAVDVVVVVVLVVVEVAVAVVAVVAEWCLHVAHVVDAKVRETDS